MLGIRLKEDTAHGRSELNKLLKRDAISLLAPFVAAWISPDGLTFCTISTPDRDLGRSGLTARQC